MSLCTVVGLLEDGETYSTELKQRQKPGSGQMGQWEHELVCQRWDVLICLYTHELSVTALRLHYRYEKPLLLQVCRLLRGFTHPGTYFEAADGAELELFR